MRSGPYQPDRGHFVWLDFTLPAGTEQAARKSALVLSPLRFNIATGLALVCPVTPQVKGGSFEVAVPQSGQISGVVLSDHVRSLDWLARNATFEGEAPQRLLDEVLARLEAILFSERPS